LLAIQIFQILSTKFNRSKEIYNADDIRWQYRNIRKFRDLVNQTYMPPSMRNPLLNNKEDLTPQQLQAFDEELEEERIFHSEPDKLNIRLGYEGNQEMMRRFNRQNDQLMRTVIMEFLTDSLNRRQALIEVSADDFINEQFSAALTSAFAEAGDTGSIFQSSNYVVNNAASSIGGTGTDGGTSANDKSSGCQIS
jgi:hypothetical protein